MDQIQREAEIAEPREQAHAEARAALGAAALQRLVQIEREADRPELECTVLAEMKCRAAECDERRGERIQPHRQAGLRRAAGTGVGDPRAERPRKPVRREELDVVTLQHVGGHHVDRRDDRQHGRHADAPAQREQQRIDRVELHFEREGPERAVRAERLAGHALQRKQVDEKRLQADLADLVIDGRQVQAEPVEREGQHQRREQHGINAREAPHPEIAHIEPVSGIGGEPQRAATVNAIAANHEEYRHARRAPGNREGQIRCNRIQAECVAYALVKRLHADPFDLAAMKIRDQQGREAPHRVDDMLLAGAVGARFALGTRRGRRARRGEGQG